MAAIGDDKLRSDADLADQAVHVTARAPHNQDAVGVAAPLDQNPGTVQKRLPGGPDQKLAFYLSGVMIRGGGGADQAKPDIRIEYLLDRERKLTLARKPAREYCGHVQ